MWSALLFNLFDEGGHDYAYHCAVEKALKRYGIVCEAHISKDHTFSYLPPHWKPRFRKRRGERFRHLPGFFLRCIALFRKKPPLPRIFFLETFSRVELLIFSAAVWCAFRKNERLFLLVRYTTSPTLFLPLRWKLRSRLHLFSDSACISESLGAITLPIPHTGQAQPPRQPEGKRVNMWWPGIPREEKGLELIKHLASLPTKRSFALYLSEEVALGGCIPIFYLKGTLKREEYEKQMAHCDVVLLPYDPIAYRARTSGVFVEAVVAGKIPFVRAGSWLAQELEKYALHELIIDWDSLDEIAEVAADSRVIEKLCAMQKDYHATHCIENFGALLYDEIADQRESESGKDRECTHLHRV